MDNQTLKGKFKKREAENQNFLTSKVPQIFPLSPESGSIMESAFIIPAWVQ